MARKLKKTRIYQEPDFTESSGYVLADAGANKPTGKISFENLGKLLGSNPLIIAFMPDGEGSYTMYRQTTFDMNVQPQFEPIDFDWLYENAYKVMVCAAIIYGGTAEHGGSPIFFFSGMYIDSQTNLPSMEFTRFDTTEDEVVTEHSIIVSTDSTTPPFTGGTTTITDRNVTIPTGAGVLMLSGTLNMYGEVSCSGTYDEVKDAYDDGKNIYLKLKWASSGIYEICPMVEFDGESDIFIFHFPRDEQEFSSTEPDSYLVTKTSFDKEYIYLWKRSQGIDNRWQRCLVRLDDLNNYVHKEAGKGLSTNDYTNADKATVTLASAAIPSDASASDQLVKESDLDAALNNAVAIVGEGAITVNEVSGSSNILKVGINEDAAPTVRSVLEAYPDPNDSSVMKYRWVSIGTVVV